MSTFLELTQELVAELGIGGANNGATVPTAVTGQTGQLWNAVNWIKQAHNNIGLLHTDWHFLWTEYSETVAAGDQTPPAHSTATEVVKHWDRGSFWLDRDTATQVQLTFVPWNEFRRLYLPGSAVASAGTPAIISAKPDNSLILDVLPQQSYTLTAEFWRRPTVLAADADTPDFPQEYHRLVICEAAIKYGNKEAAFEVIQGMEAEYITILEEMRSDQLPERYYDRMSAMDSFIEVDIPGFAND